MLFHPLEIRYDAKFFGYRNTRTVGITSLGLDHTQLLGNTYRDIAWQKSGIIKPGSSVFTTQQYDECIPVLLERSKAKNVKFDFKLDLIFGVLH